MESSNSPGVTQRVPEGLGSQIPWHSAHEFGDVVSLTHQPPLPPQEMFLVFIFTWCGRKEYVTEKSKWHHREFLKNKSLLLYVWPCIVYENDERYQLDATIVIYYNKYLYMFQASTGCPRRNVPNFGRVFLMLEYTDITKNSYVQSWTVTEIMVREVWNFDSCYTLIDYQIHIKTGRDMWFL